MGFFSFSNSSLLLILPYVSENNDSPAVSVGDFQKGEFVSMAGNLFLLPLSKLSYLRGDIRSIWNNSNKKMSALCKC